MRKAAFPCVECVLGVVFASVLLGSITIASAEERRPRRREAEMANPNPNAPPATPAGINAAIKKAIEFLYAQQNNGNWELAQAKQPTEQMPLGGLLADLAGGRGRNPEAGSQWGGLTSIATFALLAAGEDSKDVRVAKAIAFLKAGDITGTYALGLHAQVWNSLPLQAQKDFRGNIVKDAGILFKGMKQNGEARGLYHYTPDDAGFDNSCAQFGVLGMWACSQAGYEVPMRYWKEVEDAWVHHQDKSGGWTYGPNLPGLTGPPIGGPPGGQVGGPPRGPGGPPGGGPGMRGGGMPDFGVSLSMTAAGVATLYITQDYLHSEGGLDCKTNFRNPYIEAGLKWIVAHYGNLATDRHYYYTQFGISRIGLASGLKFLGDKDWYADGAAQLLSAQQPDGSWGQSVADTSFALLFLARGEAPVMMNKLQYEVTDKKGAAGNWAWDQRPRDTANLARWVGRNIEHELKWQIVNLSVPSTELHDAPILYISGSKELSFTDAQLQTLRSFAEEGGLILGNADCGKPAFAASFEKLGHALFHKYEFRDLSGEHPIFINEQYSAAKWKTKPKLRGLSNGVRELMILIPDADPARSWQSRNEKIKEESYQLGADIFLYAVDKKNLLKKGETWLVKADPNVIPQKAISMARLTIGDNPDPEPAGWPRLAAILHNQQIALTIKEATCDSESLKGVQVAHLTGTTQLKLNDAQKAAIKMFVRGGGTLIIDAAGGSTEFATSAEIELAAMYPDAMKTLAPESVVFTQPQAKVESVQYRAFARCVLPPDTKLPRIKAIDVNGRAAIFFSREDLSAGLVGEPVDGIYGYTPESATQLMSAMVQYAAPGPTTQPTTQPTTRPTTRPAVAGNSPSFK